MDLTEKFGLTAFGVTRLLASMEKIGLIQSEADARDARVSYVLLAPGGKRLLTEQQEKAELLSEEVVLPGISEKIEELLAVLVHLGGTK